jgi:DNA gyrase/topoisomerase IV subunit B
MNKQLYVKQNLSWEDKRMSKKKYGDGSITHISDDRDQIRKRPTKVIPDTSTEGVLHLLFEGYDNSLDEALNGHCKNIKVVFDKASREYTIIDSGRGIPHGDIVVACTKLNASSKFDNDGDTSYEVSGGTNGWGLKLILFLSKSASVTTTRNGKSTTLIFKDGRMVDEIKTTAKKDASGVMLKFILDDKIMDGSNVTSKDIKTIIKEKNCLIPELETTFSEVEGDKVIKSKVFKGRSMLDCIKEMEPSTPIIHIKDKRTVTYTKYGADEPSVDTVMVDIYFAFKESLIDAKEDKDLHDISYANTIKTKTGGGHVEGFKEGLTKYFKAKMANEKNPPTPADIMAAVVNFIWVRLSDTEFRGQHKDKLNSQSARIAVKDAVYEALTKEKDVNIKRCVNFIKEVTRSRLASKKAREKKSTSAFDKNSIQSYHPIIEGSKTFMREIYIGEGKSAIGPLVSARDPYNHALYILKSRPDNIFDKTLQAVSGLNTNFNELMSIIGVDLGRPVKKENLNFDKIIFGMDADIDGDSIAAYTISMIVKFAPELIRWGLVYRLIPPLYKFKDGKEKIYLASQTEFNRRLVDKFIKDNKLTILGLKMDAKDTLQFIQKNALYAKELEKASKRSNPEIIELISFYYRFDKIYTKEDIPLFERILSKYKYIQVKWIKDTIVIEGSLGDEFIHILVNRHLGEDIKKFKEIQSKNCSFSGYRVNKQPATIYQIIKAVEKYQPKDVERLKGLGELDEEEFKEQCMSVKNRTLIQIKFDDERNDTELVMNHYSKSAKNFRKEIAYSMVVNEEELDT